MTWSPAAPNQQRLPPRPPPVYRQVAGGALYGHADVCGWSREDASAGFRDEGIHFRARRLQTNNTKNARAIVQGFPCPCSFWMACARPGLSPLRAASGGVARTAISSARVSWRYMSGRAWWSTTALMGVTAANPVSEASEDVS